MNNTISSLIETINFHSKELFQYLNLLPENKYKLYLKLNFNYLSELYQSYNNSILILIHEFSKEKITVKKFKKIIETEIISITSRNIIIEDILFSIFLQLNNDIERKNNLFSLLKKNTRSIEILNNMYYSYKNFHYDLNINELKKISYNNLEFGDIVLSIKKNISFFQNPFHWLIYKITNSKIIHSTVYYDNKMDLNYYFFDTTSNYYEYFKKDILYHKYKINYSENVYGVVLRLKTKISKKEKEKIDEYFKKNTGKKYGFLKALYLAFILEMFYNISSFKKLKNSYFNTTIYCSETVAGAYENAGIILNIKEDNATITPVDLLNSDKLEIIGYIDHPQCKINKK